MVPCKTKLIPTIVVIDLFLSRAKTDSQILSVFVKQSAIYF